MNIEKKLLHVQNIKKLIEKQNIKIIYVKKKLQNKKFHVKIR